MHIDRYFCHVCVLPKRCSCILLHLLRDTQSIIKISTHVDRKTVPSIHVRNDNRHQYTVHDYYSRELHIRALVCHIRLPSNPLHSDKCRHHNDRERNTALDKRLLDLIKEKTLIMLEKYVTALRTYPHTHMIKGPFCTIRRHSFIHRESERKMKHNAMIQHYF